jgi:hypothetical protein
MKTKSTEYLDLMNLTLDKKFWEELIAYVPWYDTYFIEDNASNNSSVFCLCIHWRGEVFAQPLPSSDRGIHIDWLEGFMR